MASDPVPTAVEVVHPLKDYTEPQLIIACAVYKWLERGTLVLCEPPWKKHEGR